MIDPTCIWCGRKWSEHDQSIYGGGCCVCCLCFESLTPETAWQDENGEKWDVCVPCREHELKVLEEMKKILCEVNTVYSGICALGTFGCESSHREEVYDRR